MVDQSPPPPTPLLDVGNLEVVYNRHALAIQGVSFTVPEGGFVTILGTNGAGKSTTLHAIAGFLEGDDVEVTDGRVDYRSESLLDIPPEQVARRGVGFVPEREKIFETLTVAENLAIGPRSGDGSGFTDDDVFAYFPVLAERRSQLAGYLSGGERQMLSIASALLGRPDLLLVDELSLGLAPILVREQMELLRRLVDDLGIAVLLVEQNVASALSVADHGYVLENGRIVFDGTAKELRESDDIQAFYLGGSDSDRTSYRDVKQYRRKRRWFG